VIQEVLELFQPKSDDDSTDPQSPSSTELHLMAADTGIKDPSVLTFQLAAEVQGHQVLLLVDSGSTHSFLNSWFAAECTGVLPLSTPLSIKVANGERLVCNQTLQSCPWSCNGQEFQSQFKFLPLGTYDGILGLDWLASHSPMRVDWEEQWMSFKHNGTIVTLQSNNPYSFSCIVVELLLLHNSPDSTVNLP
jgi:hypothetical protein